MESGVEKVKLGEKPVGGEVSLDIMALTQYNGQGMCSNVDCCYETARRNREEVRSWAKRMNWRVSADMRDQIRISR